MTRIAGASLLFAVVTVTGACGVGDDDTMIPEQPDPVDNGEVCVASFRVTGTFTPGSTPRPTDPETGMPLTGCWPVGTWTFSASVVPGHNCSSTPSVLPSYSFIVGRAPADPDDPTSTDTIQTLMNTTNVGSMQTHIAMQSNGQGCVGSFELGTTDGKDYWNMKPTLAKDPGATTISGAGDYIEYKGNGWPWK